MQVAVARASIKSHLLYAKYGASALVTAQQLIKFIRNRVFKKNNRLQHSELLFFLGKDSKK
jgi:hypothetical protein